MRLHEIMQASRRVLTTDRFRKEYQKEAAVDPGFAKLLADFIETKRVCGLDDQYGRKDAPFRFGDRKGYWHCHLVYGKRVVTYKITPDTLALITLTDHAAYEGRRSGAFDAYLKNLSPSDFTAFEPPAPSSGKADASVDSHLASELRDLAYSLAADPEAKPILEAMAKGNPSDFIEMASYIPATAREVATYFGSREAMAKFAQTILAGR